MKQFACLGIQWSISACGGDLDLETALTEERPSDVPRPAVLTHFVNEQKIRRGVVLTCY